MNDKIKHYKKDAAPMDCFIVVIEKDGRVRVVGRIEAKGSKDKWAVVSRPVKNLVFDLPRFIQGGPQPGPQLAGADGDGLSGG